MNNTIAAAADQQPIYPMRSTAALTIPREFNFSTSKRKRDAAPLPTPAVRQIPATSSRAPPSTLHTNKIAKVQPNSSVRSQPDRFAKSVAIPKVSHFAASTASRSAARRSPPVYRSRLAAVVTKPAVNRVIKRMHFSLLPLTFDKLLKGTRVR